VYKNDLKNPEKALKSAFSQTHGVRELPTTRTRSSFPNAFISLAISFFILDGFSAQFLFAMNSFSFFLSEQKQYSASSM
jgi:hypothetical protein